MKIYEVIRRNEWCYPRNDPGVGVDEVIVAGFTTQRKADKFMGTRYERKTDLPCGSEDISFFMQEKRIGHERRRSKINTYAMEGFEDTCGLIREIYKTKDIPKTMSMAHATISGKAKPHLHLKTTEIYYILQGSGRLIVDEESIGIEKGDLVEIQKEKWHFLHGDLEILVINLPKFDPEDMIVLE